MSTDNSSGSVLSWIHATDSHGIGIWDFQLSYGDGSVGNIPGLSDLVPNPAAAWIGTQVEVIWTLHVMCVGLVIWLLDAALSFSYGQILAVTAHDISMSISDVIYRFGIIPTLLTVTALVTFLWMARGAWALGLYELLISLVVASVAVGVLSDPVAYVAGPDGVLTQSHELGMEVATQLAQDDGAQDSESANRQQIAEQLVDTFVRTPHQLLNFGSVIDGTRCEGVYDEVMTQDRGYLPADSDDIRERMGECDEAYLEVAESPGSNQLTSAVLLGIATFFVLGFALLCAVTVYYYSASALFHAARLVVMLIVGLLPGSARHGLWRNIADLAMACVSVVVTIVFLQSYLVVIENVLQAQEPGEPLMARFVVVLIALIVGSVLFSRLREGFDSGTLGLAGWLSWRPSGDRDKFSSRPAPARLGQFIQLTAVHNYIRSFLKR